MNWYLKVLEKYTDFNGRARRKEYWMFTLYHVIIIFSLAFLTAAFERTYDGENMVVVIVLGIYILATLIPSIAVTVRRLHDIGKSGAWYFITFIPYIGSFWLLVLTCMDSNHGSNEYGDNPKGIGNDKIIDQIGQE